METKEEILHAATLRVLARLGDWEPVLPQMKEIKTCLCELLPILIEDREGKE